MPITVNVKGIGPVNFPDTMSDEDIKAVLDKQYKQPGGPVIKDKAPEPVAKKPAATTPTLDTGAFVPPMGEFIRRMGRQLVGPVKPIQEGGQKLATAIEGVERPMAPDASIGAQVRQIATDTKENPGKAALISAGLVGAGYLGGAPAVLAAANAPNILALGKTLNEIDTDKNRDVTSYSPAARIAKGLPPEPTWDERMQDANALGMARMRGFAAGAIESVTSLSPLDAVLISLGMKKPTAKAGAVKAPEVVAPEVPRANLVKNGTVVKTAPVSPDLMERYGNAPHNSQKQPPQYRQNTPITFADAARQAAEEYRTAAPDRVELPPASSAPKPKVVGRGFVPPGRGEAPIPTDAKVTAATATQPDLGYSINGVDDTLVRRANQRKSAEAVSSIQDDLKTYQQRAEEQKAARAQEDQDFDTRDKQMKNELKAAYGKEGKAPSPVYVTPEGKSFVVPTESTPEQRAAFEAANPTAKPVTAKAEPVKATDGKKSYTQTEVSLMQDANARALRTAATKLNPKSGLRARISRLNWLRAQESLTDAQAAELPKAFRLVVDHPDLPPKLKQRLLKAQNLESQLAAEKARIKPTVEPTPAPEVAAGKTGLTDAEVQQAVETGGPIPDHATEADLAKIEAVHKGKITADLPAEEPITVRSQQLADKIEAPRQAIRTNSSGEPLPEDVGAAANHTLRRIQGGTPEDFKLGESIRRSLNDPKVQAAVDSIEAEHAAASGEGGVGKQERDTQTKLGGVPPLRTPVDLKATAKRTGAPEGSLNFKPGVGPINVSDQNIALRKIRDQFFPKYSSKTSGPYESIRGMTDLDQIRAAQAKADGPAPRKMTVQEQRAQKGEKARNNTPGTATVDNPDRGIMRPPENPASLLHPAEKARRAAIEEARVRQAQVLAKNPEPPAAIQEKFPQVEDQGTMWRNMNALAETTRQGLEHGVRDNRAIEALVRYFGAEESGALLGMPAEEARVIAGQPYKQRPLQAIMREMDARYQWLIDDPSGFLTHEALITSAGAIAGALTGATIDGETPADRAAYAIAGAIAGGALGKGIHSFIKDFKWKSAASASEALDSANLLTGVAMVKAALGSVGGVAYGIYEALRHGKMKQVRSALRYIGTQAPADFVRTMKDPKGAERLGAYAQHVANETGVYGLPHKLLDLTLRPFKAADVVGSRALKILGISQAEADRLMVLGVPTTWEGQKMLDVIESRMYLRLAMKFARVRISSLERGLEFTPGLHKINTRHASIPERVGGRFHPQERLTAKQRRTRAEYGGAALAAGTAYGLWRDPGAQETAVVAALAGPAAIPFTMGVAGGKAISRGKDPIIEALAQVAQGLPQLTEADVRGIPRRLQPLRSLRQTAKRLSGNED